MAQLYILLGRADLHWNFSSSHKDALYIHRVPTVHMVETHLLLEHL